MSCLDSFLTSCLGSRRDYCVKSSFLSLVLSVVLCHWPKCSRRSCGESSLKSCLKSCHNSFKSWPKSGVKSLGGSCVNPCLTSLRKSRLMSSLCCCATSLLKFRVASCLDTRRDPLSKSIS